MAREREKWVDCVKGIALLIVCFTHFGIDIPFFSLFKPVDVAIFFFCSGFLFDKYRYPSFKAFVFSKTRSLLVPYYALSLVCLLCDVRLYFPELINRFPLFPDPLFDVFSIDISGEIDTGRFLFLNFLRLFVFGCATSMGGPLWFLLTLFLALIVLYVVTDLKCNYCQVYLIGIFSLFVGVLMYLKGVAIPLHLESFFSSFYFVTLGYLLKIMQNRKISIFSGMIMPLLFVCFFLFLGHYSSELSLFSNNWGNPYIEVVSSTLAIVGICLGGIWLKQNFITDSKVFAFLYKMLSYVAHNAVLILATHFIALVDTVVFLSGYVYGRKLSVIIIFSTIIITLLGNFILKVSNTRWLVGKWN